MSIWERKWEQIILIKFYLKILLWIFWQKNNNYLWCVLFWTKNLNITIDTLINGFSLTYGWISFFFNAAFPYPGNDFTIILLLFNIWFACFIHISSISFLFNLIFLFYIFYKNELVSLTLVHQKCSFFMGLKFL